MSVKITLDYTNVEEAIAALGKLAGITPVAAVAVQPAVEKKERQPRADRGQPRGPNARTAGEPNAAGASAPVASAPETGSNAPSVVTAPGKAAEQAANPTATVTPAPTVAAPQAPAAVTTAPAATVVDDATIQAGVEKLFNAKGFDDTARVLSRFGVQRGKDLLPVQRAEFLAKVDAVIAGGAI